MKLTQVSTVITRIRRNGIARLMWLTVMNHIRFIKNPYLDLEAKIAFNPEGLMRLQSIRAVVFNKSGI
jgi:hypothetical protein